MDDILLEEYVYEQRADIIVVESETILYNDVFPPITTHGFIDADLYNVIWLLGCKIRDHPVER